MKRVRIIMAMCVVVGMSMVCVTPVFASDVKMPVVTPVKPPVPPAPKTLEKDQKTTDTAIKFAEDEYLRVDGLTVKEETKTFDKQPNVMGEARANTKVTITVYYENPEQRLKAGKAISKTYDTIEVGATQTFNQQIDLEVGKNRVVFKYELDKVTGSCEYYIVRGTDAEKDQLKNFIANSPAPFKQ